MGGTRENLKAIVKGLGGLPLKAMECVIFSCLIRILIENSISCPHEVHQ